MKLLLLLACAGCLDAEPATETVDQALNGDTWTTVDDNPYTGGTGATTNGIAISPTTHRIVVAGARNETNGTTTWIIRESPDGVSWSFNTAFKFIATGSSVGYNVAADSLGFFYVTGTAIDSLGRTHWVVLKSQDDGATWSEAYNNYGFDVSDTPSGITVDGSDNVYISGQYTAGGTSTAKIIRGQKHGTSWGVVFSHAGTGAANSFAGMCQAKIGTTMATYAVGWDTNPGEDVVAYYSLDGVTWTSALSYGAEAVTQAFACAPDGGNLAIAAGTKQNIPTIASNWIDTIWDVANHNQLFADSITGTGSTTENYAYAAAHVAAPVARSYFAGRLADASGFTWRTRFHPDAGGIVFSDSDNYTYPGGPHNAQARNAAYDSVNGLFVVGTAMDSSGRPRGIVRHRQ